jgi:hypothetical protein
VVKDPIAKTRAAMANPLTRESGATSPPLGCVGIEGLDCPSVIEGRVGCKGIDGRLISGWVCWILTVALGSRGLVAPSAGSEIRAVSFFGAPGLSGDGSAPLAEGAGFNGTVGRAGASDGGFGGAVTPLCGR